MWTVHWTPEADERLAASWLASPNRNEVSRAAHEVESVLETFPNSAGKALFDNVREFSCPPLDVEYEVNDDDHSVFVLNVWNTAEGRPNVTGN